MITTSILALLGIVLVIVLWQMMRSPKASGSGAPSPSTTGAVSVGTSSPAADLWSAKAGDVVSISGAAADFSDLDFPVDQRSAFEGMNRRWIGLAGDYRGRRVSLEISRAAGTEIIGFLDEQRLTLPDIALTEDGLADMDARQDPSATVQYAGARWQYESSRELSFYENEQGDSRGLYRWRFVEQGGARLIIVDKYEGEPFDVRLARKLRPDDITVYRSA